MHRHGYQGRKFHRERDQREALIQSLAEALIIHESIETTLPKAKEIVPYMEKLITKAKKADLHNRRQIISALQTTSSAHKLVDEIAPRYGTRNSGHLRVERTALRRGDNAQMARVSFVEADAQTKKSAKTDESDNPEVKTTAKPVAAKKPAPKKKTLEKAVK